MGKILDWFTQLLIEMDDEEEYVNIGRQLLSVNKYAVSTAATVEAVHEVRLHTVRRADYRHHVTICNLLRSGILERNSICRGRG
jgi:hypothetical protein